MRGDEVWVYYPGLDIPFKRDLDQLVDAANGIFLADKSPQFEKRMILASGIEVVLQYEPYWHPTVPKPQKPVLAHSGAFKRKTKRPIYW
jgi:hypothetical protein